VDVPPGPPAPAGRLRGLPNPAPGVQVISFGRPIESGGRIDVIDVRGRRRLTHGLAAGTVSWNWDGLTEDGERAECGVYLIRVVDRRGTAVTRVVRLN